MILITGGAGFIGLHTARELVEKGQEVLLVDRHTFQAPDYLTPHMDKRVKAVQGDILNPSFLHQLIREYHVSSIIHAAVLLGAGGDFYKAMKINLQGTVEILEAARISGLRRVTFLSSIAVYLPFKKGNSLHEEMDLPAISTDYISMTKKAGEQIFLLYSNEFGLSAPILRMPLVWGPGYRGELNPLKIMIKNTLAGKPAILPHIYGKGNSVYLYVRDCAKSIGLVHLAPSLDYPIYNVSDGLTHNLMDFAGVIKEIIPEASIELGEREPEEDQKSIVEKELPPMDIERIEGDLGFKPDYDLNEGIKAYIDWFRAGNDD